ncbi:MAG: hypothetical protein H0X41_01255 [Chitinophagaceae bacterium]|nr:hypothetical protein [Chitinophagaceae bacterium]
MAIYLLSGCTKEPGLVKRGKSQIIIGPDDPRLPDAVIHLSADTVYVLATTINRNKGEMLEIEPGTLIKVNDGLSININEGASITAEGSPSSPIIFTSSIYTSGAGLICSSCSSGHYWSGITINGSAGGTNPTQGSGILKYLRIEFAGAGQNIYNSLPSLLLINVNNATVVDNIQISYSSFAPSFEIQGGDVNISHIISYASNKSDFYVHGGYTGMMQNILVYRHPYFPNELSGPVLAGMYISGDGDSTTSPVISNLTVLGPDLQRGTNLDYFADLPERRTALLTSGACRFHIRNSVFMGFPKAAFYIDDYSTAHALHFGESEFSSCVVHSNDTSKTFYLPVGTYMPYISWDFKGYMLRPVFKNQFYLSSGQFLFADPFNYDSKPNPMPEPGSPLLTGANFDSTLFSNAFFQKVDYIGALGTENWMVGWTNFIPLQTNYNN